MMPILVRTTLTIDDDLMRQLKDVAHREGLPLKQVVNRTLRAGLADAQPSPRRRRYRCPTHSLGTMRVPSLEKALSVASALEDEEVARELERRK
jgi:hypothetical protein